MMKKAVQCDFDGTLTMGEVSRLLLEEFAEGDWESVGKEYTEGRISVQTCNIIQFAMVKIDEKRMREFLTNSGRVKVRPGFREFFSYCDEHGFDVVIVSNGLQLYIETILWNMGIVSAKVHAAQSQFNPDGIKLTYPGPEGAFFEDNFKEFYSKMLREEGYDIVYYVGNGASDIYPARYADHIFAIDGLLDYCQREKLPYTSFNDLYDVIRGIEAFHN
jgi:2-hydroxy-3-keto-5-methylthiopentenyl-1-phosphate phosphatase